MGLRKETADHAAISQDCFCFKYDDHTYRFGRIMAHVMFHIVEIFDYVSDQPIICEQDILDVKRLLVTPLDTYSLFDRKSEGEWRIIGRQDDYILPEDAKDIWFVWGISTGGQKSNLLDQTVSISEAEWEVLPHLSPGGDYDVKREIMEQYQSRWGEIPQTAEEHVNMIMGRYRETGDVFKCFEPKIGIFPYPKYLAGLLTDKDWDKLNNLIYQENCVQSLSSLLNTDKQSRYWAFLEMLEALAVGNIRTFELLLPNKIENVTHIFPVYRPADNMLIGLWRKDNSVLDYAVPRAEKFVSGKRPQWERAIVAYLLAVYDKNPKEAGIQLELMCKGVMRTDFDADRDKILCVPAHGLYQLVACLWDEELFRQLPMPNHKIFSQEYAIWRNTRNVQPELFVKYPEQIINDVLISPNRELIKQN